MKLLPPKFCSYLANVNLYIINITAEKMHLKTKITWTTLVTSSEIPSPKPLGDHQKLEFQPHSTQTGISQCEIYAKPEFCGFDLRSARSSMNMFEIHWPNNQIRNPIKNHGLVL
jgi:hypothetical protein